MRSHKVFSTNKNIGSTDNNYVKVRDVNPIIEDLEFIYPKVNEPFYGTIYLGRMYTQYGDKTVNAALVVQLDNERTTGGSAEIRLIGDGATTPTFSSAFTISASSDVYDSTLAAINKVIFYYDGTEAFYSITVL